MSDFKVNTITNRDGSYGPQVCGITTFTGSAIQLPSGPSTFRGRRGRGVISGGRNNPVYNDTMNLVEIATTGNAVDFGNLKVGVNGGSGNVSSTVRGIISGGYDNSANTTHINYYIFSSNGGVYDFGELTEASNDHHGYSNGRRGIFSMGYPSYSGELTFITIASTGDASDFGNLSIGSGYATSGGINSPTRAVLHSFESSASPQMLQTEFVSFDTLGNGQDFGELSVARNAASGCSSSTRGLCHGGLTPSLSDVIDYCTIATLGNFIDFGNLTVSRRSGGCCSTQTRGILAGGAGSPANTNVIDFTTISTTGNAVDFGDMTYAARGVNANSDSHGGLAQ